MTLARLATVEQKLSENRTARSARLSAGMVGLKLERLGLTLVEAQLALAALGVSPRDAGRPAQQVGRLLCTVSASAG